MIDASPPTVLASVEPSATTTAVPPVPATPFPTATLPRPTPTVAPPTATSVPPNPTATPNRDLSVYDPARIGDSLGSAQTSYAGSIAERAWNVELAAKRLDGTVVPPEGVFSFNTAVGETTLEAGFKIGYGITMAAGQPVTIPSVAGGICQVATTVFQAAFWAGLPIVERHYHLYWISRYGQPPSGQTGMDAAVDDPGLDLKFKNTTGDWIRLDAWTDGQQVGFTIVGADPGWRVESSSPRIFDVIKAIEAPVRQIDTTLAHGRELWVEHAEDGFRVAMKRLVKVDDDVIDEYAFTNKYLPARNVILFGAQSRSVERVPDAARAQPVSDTPREVPVAAPTQPVPEAVREAPTGPPPDTTRVQPVPETPIAPLERRAPDSARVLVGAGTAVDGDSSASLAPSPSLAASLLSGAPRPVVAELAEPASPGLGRLVDAPAPIPNPFPKGIAGLRPAAPRGR